VLSKILILAAKTRFKKLIKIGSRIRELRGYSQEKFAHEVGLDRTYMGSIEPGERNIATLNLIRIAKT